MDMTMQWSLLIKVPILVMCMSAYLYFWYVIFKEVKKAYENVKLISYSYCVTTTFTLLAVLNLTSWWGSFPYRMVMVLMNIVVGASMEYLVNRYSVTRRKLV